jgi:RNA polymerase sigma-70 factor (ECF subfamily)
VRDLAGFGDPLSFAKPSGRARPLHTTIRRHHVEGGREAAASGRCKELYARKKRPCWARRVCGRTVKPRAHSRAPGGRERLPSRALLSGAGNEIGVVGSRAEEAFRRHYAHVFRFIRRRVRSDDEAEELAQLVFADAVRGLENFKPGATPVLALLYTVAQRRLADRARLLARRESLAEARLQLVAQNEYGPAVASAIREALERLPDQQRAVVVMKLLQGLSFAEISKRVSATEAACKMRFARGLESMRDDLRRAGHG